MIVSLSGTNGAVTDLKGSFTASSTTSTVVITIDNDGTVVYADNIVVKQEDAPRDYSADIKGSGTNKTLTPNGNAGVGYEIPSYYGSAMLFGNDGTNGSGNTDVINVPHYLHFLELVILLWKVGYIQRQLHQLDLMLVSSVIWRWNRYKFQYRIEQHQIALLHIFNSSATNYNTGFAPLALNQWYHVALENI